jgi:hypothetical protein
MDIPEDLKQFLNLDDAEKRLDLVGGLVTPEKKGNLISLAALAEEEIATFLTRYFALPTRLDDFQSLTANNLTFHKKIEALKKVLPKLDATEANYKPHFEFLRALKKLRNTAAHSYGLNLEHAAKLSTDAEIAHLVSDFPKNLWTRVTALRDYLAALPT